MTGEFIRAWMQDIAKEMKVVEDKRYDMTDNEKRWHIVQLFVDEHISQSELMERMIALEGKLPFPSHDKIDMDKDGGYSIAVPYQHVPYFCAHIADGWAERGPYHHKVHGPIMEKSKWEVIIRNDAVYFAHPNPAWLASTVKAFNNRVDPNEARKTTVEMAEQYGEEFETW